MCGIAGFWDFKKQLNNQSKAERILQGMCDAIAFRGPDHAGYYFEKSKGLALGHRRLSILDLSEAGEQPMHSPSKRYTIVFNGEVYNAPELKIDLLAKGFQFKGTSDTEVMLACFEAYGIDQAIQKFMGMFAFALFDHTENKIFLVRDRLGVKPLYFGILNSSLVFGSQPKAFFHHPHFELKENKNALSNFLAFNYIPSNLCIFEGIEKVQPGEIICISADGNIKRERFWSLEDVAEKGRQNPLSFATDFEAAEYLDHLLTDAVKKRMIADVPLGAFLSGGVDSSAVVAMMQKMSPLPVKTFSIGFAQNEFNEAKYAKEVATHLGTEHNEVYLDAKQASAIIQKLPKFFDEPFADSSQIPTYLVSQLAREQVTVVLSGDGGDEFFGGYTRYKACYKLNKLPQLAKLLISLGISVLPEQAWNIIGRALPIGSLKNDFGYRLMKVKESTRENGEYALFEAIHNALNPKIAKNILGTYHDTFRENWNRFSSSDFFTRMQLFDAAQYLPDDILVKVDRASMAHGLEARGPLLDHRIAEFAFALPHKFKIRGNKGKWILRQVLDRYVPRELIERPKMGFAIPLESWLKNDLRQWAEDLISPQKLSENGFEKPDIITKRWQEFITGKHNWSFSLWGMLMYQAWQQEYKNYASQIERVEF